MRLLDFLLDRGRVPASEAMVAERLQMPPITSAPAPDEPAGRLALERMVLFTDAVFAIVMTLMAIEIRLPSHPAGGWTHDTLSHALAELGPRFLAYAVSFLVAALL